MDEDGHHRKVPTQAQLVPLLEAMKAEAGDSPRLVRSDDPKRKLDHGLPPIEALSTTLRRHLERADVDRPDLFEGGPDSKRVTFYDLRAAGITWEILDGTEHVRVMQRAGHKSFTTTLGYVREADDITLGPDELPFPALPSTIVATDKGLTVSTESRSSGKHTGIVASPTGFEPVLQP